MKIVYQVNQGPDSADAQQALSAAQDLLQDDQQAELAAVFFYFDGVRHAAADAGEAWAELAEKHHFPLLICRSAWQRRYDELPTQAYQLSSLTDYVLWLEKTDQVQCFGSGA